MPSTKKTKNIIAIESWDKFNREPSADMHSLLTFVCKTNEIEQYYYKVHTAGELSYLLRKVPTKTSGLLYIASHGEPNTLLIGAHKETKITLDKLADLMEDRFEGYGVHFGSCAVMSADVADIRNFIEKTGVAFVTGYDQYVDFGYSAVIDHAFLYEWAWTLSYAKMFSELELKYGVMLSENGFAYMLRDDLKNESI